MVNENALCQQYLNTIYHDTQKDHFAAKSLAETQGDILDEGVDRLLLAMQLTEQDVFVDLGSGAGRVVAQIFLKTRVKEARGIEWVLVLHDQATVIAERIEHDLPDFYAGGRQLVFTRGDFLEVSFEHATVILINGICLNQKTIAALLKKMDRWLNIRMILSTRPLPLRQSWLFEKAIRIECSWDTALCYVYVRV